MHAFHNLVNAILVIVFIYALALFLRRKGTLTEEHSLTLARIVTDLCLPAIIFVSLARQSIRLDQIKEGVPMKSRWIGIVVIISFILGLAATGWTASYKPEYKLSVVVAPTSPWGQGAQMFADLVKEKSDGRINIRCYFSGRLLAGKQTNEFLLLKQGVADFALGSTIN